MINLSELASLRWITTWPSLSPSMSSQFVVVVVVVDVASPYSVLTPFKKQVGALSIVAPTRTGLDFSHTTICRWLFRLWHKKTRQDVTRIIYILLRLTALPFVHDVQPSLSQPN
jgi:hypothetical protein